MSKYMRFPHITQLFALSYPGINGLKYVLHNIQTNKSHMVCNGAFIGNPSRFKQAGESHLRLERNIRADLATNVQCLDSDEIFVMNVNQCSYMSDTPIKIGGSNSKIPYDDVVNFDGLNRFCDYYVKPSQHKIVKIGKEHYAINLGASPNSRYLRSVELLKEEEFTDVSEISDFMRTHLRDDNALKNFNAADKLIMSLNTEKLYLIYLNRIYASSTPLTLVGHGPLSPLHVPLRPYETRADC